MKKLLERGWCLALILAVMAFVFRALASCLESHSIFHFMEAGLLVACFYLLFILEGILDAAAHIKATDEASFDGFINSRFSAPDQLKIKNISNLYRNHYGEFIIGRQLLSIAVIVMIALLLDALPLSENNVLLTFITWTSPATSAAFLKSWLLTFLISALMPYWLSQLLPQLLADSRSVQFSKLFLGPSLSRLSKRIASVGIGYPSQTIHRMFQHQKLFTDEEQIPIGMKSFYEMSLAHLGMAITERTVTIVVGASATKVTDRSRFRFTRGEHQDVRHVLRTINNIEHSTLLYDQETPPGVRYAKPISKIINVGFEDAQRKDGSITGSETLALYQIPLGMALPRTSSKPEDVVVTVNYETTPVNLGSSTSDTFNIDVAHPTELLVIKIDNDPELLVRPPNVRECQIDEMALLGSESATKSVEINFSQVGMVWLSETNYPRQNIRLLIDIDARILAETN